MLSLTDLMGSCRTATTRIGLSSVAAFAIGVAAATPAQAALTYSYFAGTSDFPAVPGGTVQVPIYVREIVSEPSTSLLVSDGGLYSGGVTATRAGFTGSAAAITSIVGNSGSTPANGGFSGGNSTTTNPNAASATLEINVNASMIGAAATSFGVGEYRVLLGTLTILAPNAAGVSTFSLSPLVPASTLTNTGRELDTASLNPVYAAASPSSFTVTVVPEPSAALAFAGTALGVLRRNRSRSQSAEK